MPKIVAVSACLLGVPCRYDGTSKPSLDVQEYLRLHDCTVVKICPEVMGGLMIPHPPHEIQRCGSCDKARTDLYRVIDCEGNDHTHEFVIGAQKACLKALEAGCTHAILKAKSPSCGVGEVYDGTFSQTLVPGDGIAAALLREAGLVLATEKDFVAQKEEKGF